MPFLRRLLLLAVIATGSIVFAGSALARPAPGPLGYSLGTTHFLVHYGTDRANPAAITETQAGDIAALAERAYAAELADGYPAPPSDGAQGGDSRIDIYVTNLAGAALGLATTDNGTSPDTGWIELDGSTGGMAFDQHTIAHELFHLVQFGIWVSAGPRDAWIYEGSAEWMGYRVNGYGSAHPFGFGPRDMALDCLDANGGIQCSRDAYAGGGYSRWPFFEYLIEKYGTTYVKDIFTQGAAGAGNATAAIGAALAAKGTTLSDTYNDFTSADLVGAYTVKALQGRDVPAYTSVPTGVKTGPLGSTLVPVNHLSTRIVEFDRGDGDATHACFAATLSLTVTIPAGTLSKPVFWWNAAGNAPVPLSVSGNTGVASIPWDTCNWPQGKGFLALPNASTSVDAADFKVSSSLNVDTSMPVTTADPPPAATTNTTVVNVSNTDGAPTVTVAGAVVIKLAAKERVVRLLVESSGDGKLHASMGGVDLGSPALRAGNNDIRFTLPESALTALRRSASTNVLTLTVISPQGTQTGLSLTRSVVVGKPAKTKKRIRAHK